MTIERRSILKGLVALIAAPAIIKVGSIMPINSGLVPGNSYLAICDITREAVRLFHNSNEFIKELDEQYKDDRAYYEGMQWSQAEMNAMSLRYNRERRSIDRVPQIVGPLALAAVVVAVAPAILEKPVTRRFWSK